jgi:Cd2+/Zn2+-exporting ATPase
VTDIEVTRKYQDSSLARIIYLVQEATLRKAKTELFIRKFAEIYTPIVVGLAAALTVLPYFFVTNYDFSDWLYRALIFLVISCPCALVISIPLGYFGGIGAASRRGILLKGANFLDRITEMNKVALDKTGTLTEGSFRLKEVHSRVLPEQYLLNIVASLESRSSHPIARSLSSEIKLRQDLQPVKEVREVKGQGIIGLVGGRRMLIGNSRLLRESQVEIPDDVLQSDDLVVHVAVDETYAGTLVLGDTIKADAAQTILKLKEEGIHDITLLSGDSQQKTDEVARELQIPHAVGDLLPEHKLTWLEEAKRDSESVIAYVGDGINDAPAIAMADVGIAMGGMGTDAAIETADVVIQSDQPSRIITARKIGQATKRIVWQNISLAFGVKAIVLALGAWGIASMWEAVFADVGVALLAILNAIRLQYMRFE